MASLSHFYRYYFGRCSSELAHQVLIPFFRERSTCYSDRLQDFLSPFLDVARMSMSTVSLLAQLDTLPIECFLLTVYLNGFKSGINRHHLTVGFF